MDRQIPSPGEVFKHFKGNCYKILAVGHHSETGEKMVIYRDMADENSSFDDPCIRPLDMLCLKWTMKNTRMRNKNTDLKR